MTTTVYAALFAQLNMSTDSRTRQGVTRGEEILGALRANLLNVHLERVHVLYETNHTTSQEGIGCTQLHELVKVCDGCTHAKLVCVPVHAQPTYADLFKYANSTVAGRPNRVAIVANSDIVFDGSLGHMPPMTASDVYALSVNTAPDALLYESLVGVVLANRVSTPDARCPGSISVTGAGHADSMDAFAFVQLPADVDVDIASQRGFSLNLAANQIGSENRAFAGLCALGLSMENACGFVQLQHWHRSSSISHKKNVVGLWRKNFGQKSLLYRYRQRKRSNPSIPEWNETTIPKWTCYSDANRVLNTASYRCKCSADPCVVARRFNLSGAAYRASYCQPTATGHS